MSAETAIAVILALVVGYAVGQLAAKRKSPSGTGLLVRLGAEPSVDPGLLEEMREALLVIEARLQRAQRALGEIHRGERGR